MGKKYRIEYERGKCIGAAACTAVDPEDWSLATDGKADLKDSKENEESKIFVMEIDEEQYKKFKDAAEACPVNVIHIVEIETGKKII